MRHNAGGRRLRNRHNNGGGGHNNGGQRHHRGGGNGGGNGYGNNRSQVFDSNGPEVRIRGTAFQICEKYQALAKDAFSADNRVLAESYLQHAEHYQRIINVWNEENPVREQRISDVPAEQPVVESTVIASVSPEAAQTDDDLGLPASLVAPVRQLAEA